MKGKERKDITEGRISRKAITDERKAKEIFAHYHAWVRL